MSESCTTHPTQDIVDDIKALQLNSAVKEKESIPSDDFEDKKEQKKRHLNVVLIGHVDAGKSTIGGQILYLSGQVDERTKEKYQKEAKDKSRGSWYMAYIMDTNEEERAKGKTVEIGRPHFETKTTRFTMLDAPEDITGGFVLSSVARPVAAISEFLVELLILELRTNEMFTAGFKAVLHIHAVVEECEVLELTHQIDSKTRKRLKLKHNKPIFCKKGDAVQCRIQVTNMICIEKYSDFPQLGRFTLRNEGTTVAVGKIIGLTASESA